ncbi:DUF2207 domain-containing protein [Candidatus Saccharibacteria bacterium]|nr:DUF2207 domain-containing protein [Candidatus Saccharibacteria bacterium]
MKKSISFIGLAGIFLAVFGVVAPANAASVNDFYFSDFTGDYYLYADDEGVSHLKVTESVTAEFPDYNQNKGICRQIPFTNQNGKNLVLPNLTKENLTLTRNGNPEPIYSIEREGDYFNVCTGTEEYVLGSQTYVFQYEFDNVVTEFAENDRIFQELYWDTNGNGSVQKFDKVTAKLRFEDKSVWTGDSWCYVGKYGENGQERCTITKTDDGVTFQAENLTMKENLTFDVELKEGSFVLPAPKDNYGYVWMITALGVLCALLLLYSVRKYMKTRGKASFYKGIFVKPEYQPSKDYSISELAEIYIGEKRDMKVAMLLDMIVKHQIQLKKDEDGKKWGIIVDKLDKIPEESIDLLSILNGGTRPANGDTIKIEKHRASNRLVTLKSSMQSKILGDLKKDGLVENNYTMGYSGNRGLGNVLSLVFVFVPGALLMLMFIFPFLTDFFGMSITAGQNMIYEDEFLPTVIVMVTATIVIWASLGTAAERYIKHTEKGLEASRYMDGLKLYIKMAEAERMEMLQSVKGADTSPKGIVKLYEKLLPYAAVFGLEKSWMDEMKQYCEVQEVEEPDYLLAGITASEIARTMQNASNYISNATVMSSSGGSSSSGFSGGGGGGFSGGGGGGGGFSGR